MAHTPERRKTVRRKDEETLRSSEEKYRRLLDNASDAILLANDEGHLLEVNRKAEELLGYTRKELLGVNISKIHPKEELEKIINGFKEINKKGSGTVNNTAVLRKDGRTVSIDISGSVIEYSGKKVLQGIFRDITEHRQMEETLRKSEERYRNILESIQEGYFELDLAGNYTFVNEANCRFLGYTKEEMVGMNFRQHTDEEAAKKLYQSYRELYRTGKPIETLEVESIRKDGTKVIYETSVSLIGDSAGKLIGYRGVSRDITERKKMEETLRRSEEKYRTIIENMHEPYYEDDLAGNFTFVNSALCSTLGYTKEELIGLNYLQYNEEKTARRLYELYSAVYRTGKPVIGLDMEAVRKDGTKVNYEISVSLIKNSEGKPIGFRGLSRDVTERKLSENALRQSEERYRNILESIDDGYCEQDFAGNFIFLNDSMCRIYGYPKEELMGMNYKQHTDRENGRKCFQAYRNIYRTGEPGKVFDFEIIRKDGTKRHIESSVSLQKDSAGKPIAFKGIVRDITDRKKMEEALRRSEEKYRTILKNMQEGYFEVDLAGNLTFINDALCDNLRFTREELIGMNFSKFSDETNARELYKVYNKIYRTGEPVKTADFEFTRKDGTKLFAETSASLIRDAEGNLIGFRGVSRDVTDRKLAEDSLRQSEEKYRTVLEDMEEGYFEVDLSGNFTFVNNAECINLGYSREELIGMNNRQYQDEVTVKKMYQLFNTLYKTGEPVKVLDVEVIRKDGTKIFNETSIFLIKDAKGKPTGFRGVSRDITARKRAEDALRKNREELIKKNQEIEDARKNIQITLERLGNAYEELKASQAKILQQEKMASIGHLAAGVAHEINNPMAFIASNLGTLDKYIRRLLDFIQMQEEMFKSLKATDTIEKLGKKRKELKLDYIVQDVKQLITESLDGSERVQKIVQGLNRFSRVDNAEYKDADINGCIENSIKIVWNELKNKATLTKNYGNFPHTKCYPQQLNQVFVNLLINAVQSIKKQGEIAINTWSKDGSIWITVSDTGCGISKENQSKVFEPFFTTKEVGKGTGLGLSISYEIIQRHKGEITFESKAGKGTTFTIRIPII
jgi:two-component system NtrC family sensor kinase